MKINKVLLIVTLLCGWSAAASAQGLVGAPVDPRYGQSNTATVSRPSARTVKGQRRGVTTLIVVNALIAAMRMVRL